MKPTQRSTYKWRGPPYPLQPPPSSIGGLSLHLCGRLFPVRPLPSGSVRLATRCRYRLSFVFHLILGICSAIMVSKCVCVWRLDVLIGRSMWINVGFTREMYWEHDHILLIHNMHSILVRHSINMADKKELALLFKLKVRLPFPVDLGWRDSVGSIN